MPGLLSYCKACYKYTTIPHESGTCFFPPAKAGVLGVKSVSRITFEDVQDDNPGRQGPFGGSSWVHAAGVM